MSGRRASNVRERATPQSVNKPQRHNPLPAPLDSCFRWNDDLVGPNGQEMPRLANGRLLERSVLIAMTVVGVGAIHIHSRTRVCHFSYQSLIPACAGTPRNENRSTGWWVFSTVARDQGWLPDCRERGTSPRATFCRSAIEHRATDRLVVFADGRHEGRLEDAFSYQSPMQASTGTPRGMKTAASRSSPSGFLLSLE